ncbi:MAG TPA: flagella basal body P-ring formation protein FlgA [Gammaproteobacteria bacterium]|jgi:flagella basal body P-ring formation protein FlgA|nr:flagella basal body P-ring formation protein FlgA [Gammaproteobacteria bacterium]HBG52398.1 flagella basal body P-ring formation protein FlgA [Gammaproteobacteria bacterium]
MLLMGFGAAAAAESPVNVQIRAAVEAALQAQWPDQTLEIDLIAPDARLNLSPCERPLAIEPLRPGPLRSAATLSVVCDAPESSWRVYVPARISAMGEVLVASRPLPAGTVLTAQDVTLARRRMTDLSYGYLKHAEAAVGSTLRRPVTEGAVILPSQLAQAVVVRRGQQVVIEAASGSIRVQGNGEALADGLAGRRLKVRNGASGRIVEGTVQADGRVRVDF